MSLSVPQRRHGRLGPRPRTRSHVNQSSPSLGSCTPRMSAPLLGVPTATERRQWMVSAAATGARTSEAASRAQASRPRTMSAERAAVLTLVVLAIGAAPDRLPPPLVVAVPIHGPLESLGEVHPRLPTELRAD